MQLTLSSITTLILAAATAFSLVSGRPTDGHPAPTHVPADEHAPMKAVVYINSNATITGTISFSQPNGPESITHINGTFTGLTPESKHGLHIHQYGDLSQGCLSLGPHYNPYNETHGGPDATEKHMGDLGNIDVGHDGTASFQLDIDSIDLSGPYSVLGRGVVIHAKADDYGLGGAPESNSTGNSGPRWACGIIVAAN